MNLDDVMILYNGVFITGLRYSTNDSLCNYTNLVNNIFYRR